MLSLGPVQVHTTTLVSGVLLILIGLLVLRFAGTAGITGVLGAGDTADLEVMLQERITAALAIATVVVMLARGRPRDDARAGFVSPEEGSPPPSVAVPGTFAEDVLAGHRRRSLEALDRQAGGQPLCRVGPAASDGLKQAEDAVAVLSEVARRHRALPEEGLTASAAHVLQA